VPFSNQRNLRNQPANQQANNQQAGRELWWQEPPVEGKNRCFVAATTVEQEIFPNGTDYAVAGTVP